MKPTEWMKQNDQALYDHIMNCTEHGSYCERVRAFIIVVERYESIQTGLLHTVDYERGET